MPADPQQQKLYEQQMLNQHMINSMATIKNPHTDEVQLVSEKRPRDFKGPKPRWSNSDVFRVVKADDMELKITLGQKPLELTGKLQTRDKREPGYYIRVICQVRDPNLFAQTYRQSGDPVNLARTQIDGALQEYARTKTADELDPQEVRNIVLAWGSLPHHLAGLAFISINRLELMADKYTAAADELRLAHELDQVKGELNASLTRSNKQHELEIEKLQRQHAQELQLFEQHVQEALREVKSGHPESEVLAKYREESGLLQLIFGAARENAIPSGPGRPALAAPAQSPVVIYPDPLDAGGRITSGPPKLPPPPGTGGGFGVQTGTFRELPDASSSPEVGNSTLGITMVPVVLGGREAEICRIPSGSQVLRVSSVDPNGLGYSSGLRYGHILLKINGDPVTNPRLITPMLNSADSDTAQLEVFGGEQLLTLAVKM